MGFRAATAGADIEFPTGRRRRGRLATGGAGLGFAAGALGSGWRRLAGAMGLRLAAGGWAVAVIGSRWLGLLGFLTGSRRRGPWVCGCRSGSRALALARGRWLGPMGLWLGDAGLGRGFVAGGRWAGPWISDWRPLVQALDSGLVTARWGPGFALGFRTPRLGLGSGSRLIGIAGKEFFTRQAAVRRRRRPP
jgi:hypothetical protein